MNNSLTSLAQVAALGLTKATISSLLEESKQKLDQSITSSLSEDAAKKLIADMLSTSGASAVKVQVGGRDSYDSKNDIISIKNLDPAVVTHEAGHAIQNSRIPGMVQLGMGISRGAPRIIDTATLVEPYLRDKNLSKFISYAPFITLASSLPELALEYDASRRAKNYLRNNRPDLYQDAAKKMDSALLQYLGESGSSAAATAASLAVGKSMSKSAGLVSGTVRLAGKGAKLAVDTIGDQVRTTSSVVGGLLREKGLKNKAKVSWKAITGEDSAPKSLGGKIMHRVGLVGAASTPVVGAYNIAKDPTNPAVWGKEIGQAAGEVLGGGKLLGSMLFSNRGGNYGEAVGNFVKRSSFETDTEEGRETLSDVSTAAGVGGMVANPAAAVASKVLPSAAGHAAGVALKAASKLLGPVATIAEMGSHVAGGFNAIDKEQSTLRQGFTHA